MSSMQQYIRAYVPKGATNTEHPCLRTLINQIEEQKRLQEESTKLLADADMPDFDPTFLIEYLKDNDFDQIKKSDKTFKFDFSDILLKNFDDDEKDEIAEKMRKIYDGLNVSVNKTSTTEIVTEELDTSAIHDWIDERIGTTVIVVDGENEYEMPWEELHANHAWRHKHGNKACGCKQPTKIKFNNKPHPLPECLESIQVSHEAYLWFLSPSGIQLNWNDGTSTYLPYGHPDLVIIQQSLLGEQIKKLCECHHRIIPEGVFF